MSTCGSCDSDVLRERLYQTQFMLIDTILILCVHYAGSRRVEDVMPPLPILISDGVPNRWFV
jgi:hypothetical protein